MRVVDTHIFNPFYKVCGNCINIIPMINKF